MAINPQRSSNAQVLLYAMPAMAIAFINLPSAMVLPTFYVEHTAATLTGIGVVNLLRWWFDAATDPIVGYLSDRTRTRWGKRLVGPGILGVEGLGPVRGITGSQAATGDGRSFV